MKYLCKCNMFFLQKHVASHRWQFDSLNIGRCLDGHRPVPGRASADLLRDIWKFPALVRHRTMPGRAPYDARMGTVGIVRDKLKKKIVRCPSDVCKRRPGAVRAPYGARPMSFYPRWPYQTPYGRRGILCSTLTSPATVRCLTKMIKNVRFFLPPAGRRTGSVESYDFSWNRRRTVPVDDLWP